MVDIYLLQMSTIKATLSQSLLRLTRDNYGKAKQEGNWLQVLGTTERSQVDQRVCHQLHAIMPLLDAFKSEQQPLEFVLPRKGPLDPHA